MAMQCAEASRTVASLLRMNEAGDKVVLDGKDSFMINCGGGKVAHTDMEDGKFVFNIWARCDKEVSLVIHDKTLSRDNRFAVLREQNDEGESQGCTWQGNLL